MAKKRNPPTATPGEADPIRKIVEREPHLLVHAAYWLAGRVVAERMFGRSLLRVPCPADLDDESLRRVLCAFPASCQFQAVGKRIYPWLLEVGRLEQVRRLSEDEAAAFRRDLWAPLLLWINPAGEVEPDPTASAAAR